MFFCTWSNTLINKQTNTQTVCTHQDVMHPDRVKTFWSILDFSAPVNVLPECRWGAGRDDSQSACFNPKQRTGRVKSEKLCLLYVRTSELSLFLLLLYRCPSSGDNKVYLDLELLNTSEFDDFPTQAHVEIIPEENALVLVPMPPPPPTTTTLMSPGQWIIHIFFSLFPSCHSDPNYSTNRSDQRWRIQILPLWR